MYRVFLLPGNVQVDLSFTPGSDFGALGPKFSLLWGSAVQRTRDQPHDAQHYFGYAAHHLVRARICIERGRAWQAEYWISAASDYALSLACLRLGLETSNGRGLDKLPKAILEPAEGCLFESLGRIEVLRALGRTIELLLKDSQSILVLSLKFQEQLLELALPFGDKRST
jgi:hypothetical protein